MLLCGMCPQDPTFLLKSRYSNFLLSLKEISPMVDSFLHEISSSPLCWLIGGDLKIMALAQKD